MLPYTQAELKEVFRYAPTTGRLRWRVSPAQGVAAGSTAGSLHPQGYIMVQFRGRIYAAHRVIWKLIYGTDPNTVDHKNGVRHDNRLRNLRNVTRTKNLQLRRKTRTDSQTGVLGVTYRKDCRKYQARIQRNGRMRSLGLFPDIAAAEAAYVFAKRKEV